MQRFALALSAAALALFAAGCGDDKDNAKKDTGGKGDGAAGDTATGGAKGGAAYDPATSKGSVSGTVRFGGARPPQATLTITGDAVCETAWKDKPLVADKVVVNEDGSLPWAFVWAHKGPHTALKFQPRGDFVLDQKNCVYAPHVFGLMAGEKFTVKNSDNTLHNVHVKPTKNDPINQPQRGGAADTFTFTKKEKAIPFGCDVHSWMSAVAFVLDHPFFATTDASGKFEITGLPDGEYTFKAWHEAFSGSGEMETDFSVTIKDGQAVTKDVELK